MQPTRIIPFGGVQEIGKSTLVVEHDEKVFIVDAGIKFADTAATGIKGIIPDYSYLKDKNKKIQGLFITHGHEDHIGGVIHLVRQVDVPTIYAPRIAIQYLKLKFDENKINVNTKFVEIEKEAIHRFGDCQVDFWSAQHSIPDAFGIRIKTPNGSLMCTGDFRFDYNPIGNFYTDFAKLDKMGKEGLTILLSDSTNAMRPDHSPSENDILTDIKKYMVQAKKKIIVTAFASNLTRMKAIIELAVSLKKKIAIFGRSMVQGVKIGRKLGYIDAPSNVFIDKKEIANVPDNKLVILTTGSQGEQLAALNRMSLGKHQSVRIDKGDLVIFSSSPIPGNRQVIELLVNRLSKQGAIIKENGVDGYLHTSGHAYKHEHDKIFQLTKPKYFLPYHGEYRMCVTHGQSAIRNGVDEKNIIIPEIGRVYHLDRQKVYETDEKVNTGPIFIDGYSTLNINAEILKERLKLANSGFVNVILTIDRKENNIVGRPVIVSRGSFYVKTSLKLIEEAKRIAHGTALFFIKNSPNWNVVDLKQLLSDRLEGLFYKEKRRRPVIIPTILYLNENDDEVLMQHKISFVDKKTNENEEMSKSKKLLAEIKEDIFGSSDELDDEIHDEEDDE